MSAGIENKYTEAELNSELDESAGYLIDLIGERIIRYVNDRIRGEYSCPDITGSLQLYFRVRDIIAFHVESFLQNEKQQAVAEPETVDLAAQAKQLMQAAALKGYATQIRQLLAKHGATRLRDLEGIRLADFVEALQGEEWNQNA